MTVGPRPIRGKVGRIDWGYFAAAAIMNFIARRLGDGTWSLHGIAIDHDAFKLSQRPLVFIAPHKDGEWRWPVKTIELGPGKGPREFVATLGPQLPQIITAVRR
jgi:hypothetical protein